MENDATIMSDNETMEHLHDVRDSPPSFDEGAIAYQMRKRMRAAFKKHFEAALADLDAPSRRNRG